MKNNRILTYSLILVMTIAGLIATAAAAPPITVTSTLPSEAEQGTTQLLVVINGRGFDENSTVEFAVSGSCDSNDENCNPGDVIVEPGSVRHINSKKLEVTVDIGLAAVLGPYDVLVKSNGRRGRGTELFTVLNSNNGRGNSDNLEAEFCLTIDPFPSPYIESDVTGPGAEFCNSEENVLVFTGTGPGFGWITNTQNSIRATRKFATARTVNLNILDVYDTAGIEPGLMQREVDFRFWKGTGGLDLGSLVAQVAGVCPGGNPTACTGSVPAHLEYFSGPDVVVPEYDETDWGVLGFGATITGTMVEDVDTQQHDNATACLAATALLVTRTGEKTWTLEPKDGKACRFAMVGNGGSECTNTHDCTFESTDIVRLDFKLFLVQEEL